MKNKIVFLVGFLLLGQSYASAEKIEVSDDRASYEAYQAGLQVGYQRGLQQGRASCAPAAGTPIRQLVSQSCECRLESRARGNVIMRSYFSDRTSEVRTIHTNARSRGYTMFPESSETCEGLADQCNRDTARR